MRVYDTVLFRLAPASSMQHPTDPTLISQRMLCFPRGDAPAKRLSLYAGFCHRAGNTRLRQATKQPTEPTLFPSDSYAFAEVFSLAQSALRCCFLSKALVVGSVAARKKSRGRAGAS